MNIDLMIDTLNMIADKTQSSIQQTVRKPKSTSQKLRFVSLHLLQLKHEIYEWLENILMSCKDVQKMRRAVAQIRDKALEQVSRHRLHVLLRQKLKKMKKQSLLHSMSINIQSESFLKQDQSKLADLQRSVLNIQKDLNIEEEMEEEGFGVSAIIERSRMNLNFRQQQSQLNESVVTGYSVLGMSPVVRNENKSISRGEEQVTVFGKDVKIDSFLAGIKDTQISSVKSENLGDGQRLMYKDKIDTITTQFQESWKEMRQQGQINTAKLSIAGPKVMKKKKKSIYTSMGNDNKEGLLGNLLEESYQHCVQSQQSTK